jgi:hypothetical protein
MLPIVLLTTKEVRMKIRHQVDMPARKRAVVASALTLAVIAGAASTSVTIGAMKVHHDAMRVTTSVK